MAFTKSHPQNSWEAEHAMATNYVRDSQAHLNSLQAQLDECDTQISSAETVIQMLEPSTDRRVRAEVGERKHARNHLQATQAAIQKSFATVEARLKRQQASLAEFPLLELKKEQTLRNAKRTAGSLPAGAGFRSLEGGTVTNYGG
jgi:hypothetical protein